MVRIRKFMIDKNMDLLNFREAQFFCHIYMNSNQINNKRSLQQTFARSVWDPYPIKKYTNNIEKVQRRAARFVFNRYHNTSSPTDTIQQLQWESLEQRCRKARLTMFYKIQPGLVAVPLPDIVTRALRPRPGYPHQYQTNYHRTNSYKNIFSHSQ